jgi:O-antigen ligase
VVTRAHRTLVVGVGVAAIVTAANASQGAYFSQSWGWVALAFLVPTTVLLILDRVQTPGRLRIAFATLMGALAVWIALSAVWSISTSASVRELERMLAYVAVALAVAFVLRRGDGPAVVGGALLGIALVCSYGLATRLLPDRLHSYDDTINSYRLAQPLGYWNALGILATMGIVVALGVVAHARRRSVAAGAAAVVPVLFLTLYFTFSRGAIAALAIGVVVTTVVDPRRLRYLITVIAMAIPTALCVLYASGHKALTTENATQSAATRDGHHVAAALCAFVLASALAGLGSRALSRRLEVSRRTRRAIDAALVGAAVLGAVIALLALGGLAGVEDSFDSEPVTGVDLNHRLFSISGNGRDETLRVAWRDWEQHRWLGSGAGSYEYVWYQERPSTQIVRDAHSLYLETGAELGAVGVVGLVAVLLVLLIACVRGRRHRFTAAATGTLIAWMAASALDWHWEMVGVTMTALVVGSVGLIVSERGPTHLLLGRARMAATGALSVLSVLAVWSLVGNQALFAGRDALARKDWADARRDARRAHALLPWSHEPDLVLGDAAAGLGDRERALRAYRDAVAADPRNWVAWLRLAQVARGSERTAAYRRAHQLNPREEGIPGA